MKKIKHVMSLAVILGLLAALPATAQMEVNPGTDESNLGLLITINRLELTTDQMQQVHDILVGILDEANVLKESRDAFEQEMLHFNGTGEALEGLLEAFRNEQSTQASALRETAQRGLDELKSILTLRQGEILGDTFTRLLGLGRITPWNEQTNTGPLGMRGQTMGKQPTLEMRERVMDRLRERIDDEGADPERIRHFLSNRPELQGKRMEKDWNRFSDSDQPGHTWSFGPMMGERLRSDSHPFAAWQFGARALVRLQQLVEILEMKLQYVE